jgi:hypothetical protein
VDRAYVQPAGFQLTADRRIIQNTDHTKKWAVF